ncbi:MAG: ABC transporter permease [Bacteroidota bacterium]
MGTRGSEWILRFFRWFSREEYHEEIEGDLIEIFNVDSQESNIKAGLVLAWTILRYIRPEYLKITDGGFMVNRYSIFVHNLKIVYRGLLKYRSTFSINLIGLSTAFACVFLIYLWADYEYSVDTFHLNDDNIYQVLQNKTRVEGIKTDKSTPALLAEALVTDFPELDYAVTTNRKTTGMLSGSREEVQGTGKFVGADFLEVFSFPLLQGNKSTVFIEKNSIVLTEDLATALFGTTQNVLGMTVKGNRDLFNEEYVVTGVLKTLPTRSTLTFDFLISYEQYLSKYTWFNDWDSDGAITYISIKDGADANALNQKIEPYLEEKGIRESTTLLLQKFSDAYLYNKYEHGRPVPGRLMYVRLFLLVSLFILLVACINFINLSIAQSTHKLKEIGVSKAIGITKRELIHRFLFESALMVFFSAAVATVLVIGLLPQFNIIFGKDLSQIPDPGFILKIIGFLSALSILAGLYPAYYLSSFSPTSILKNTFVNSHSAQWIKKGLVVVQFCISLIFITGFIVVHQQITFLKTSELGYTKDNIVHFNIRGNNDVNGFINAVKEIPGVQNATNVTGGNSIVNISGAGRGFSWQGSTESEDILFARPQVGYNFAETLELELLEGRSFNEEYGNEESKLMVNELAAALIGKEDIIGKTINDGDDRKQIIGVVKNFNLESLHKEIQPTIIRFYPDGTEVMVRISSLDKNTLSHIEELYNSYNIDYPFSYTFISDQYEELYRFEERVSVLSRYFSVIAVIISSLGLFALVAFTIEKRMKEIGIRKILGASNLNITRLLTGSFSSLVVISMLISSPISYSILTNWLSNFAYRITVSWWVFFIGLGMLLFSVWFTVGVQALKAVRLNPVSYLKQE